MMLQLFLRLDGPGHLAQQVVALWLSYLVHGLFWSAAAACLTRGRSAGTQSALWKLALFGPLFSTLVSAAVGWLEAQEATHQLSLLASQSTVDLTALVETAVLRDANVLPWRVLALLVLGSVSFGLLRFLASAARLRAALRSRRELCDPRLRTRFEQLRRQTRLGELRLSESGAIHGPLIVGGRELCVSDSLASLADAQLDAVFAHELAHLQRRDGFWFPAAGFVQMVFWLHPSNAWVAARMRRAAEHACDDRALALTGDALNLARALTALAERAVTRHALFVPAIAGDASAALARVVRLLEERPKRADTACTRWMTLACAVAAAGLCCVLVRVGAKREAVFDPATWEREMWSLALREQRASQELSALAQTSVDSLSAATRRDELEQELRHVRAAQQWTEQRYLRKAGAAHETDDR